MVNMSFYFQVHQPFRLRNYRIFDINKNSDYFDEKKNREIIEKVERKCYRPANKLMLDLIHKHDGNFKIAYSLSGVYMEQLEKYSPKLLDTFKELADTGCVEFLSETYHHSLSFLHSKNEFDEQIDMHKKKIKDIFGKTPTVFRNTELIYNNELANHIEKKGYKAILAEGWDPVLGWRSPNFVYTPKTCSKIKLLLKNYKLSDDVAFRFSNKGWKEWPLTIEKYNSWINSVNGNGEVINLFMDYETFGEHQWSDTGIFQFLKDLPSAILSDPDNHFMTPSEVADNHNSYGELDIHNMLSWADMERDLSAWMGNKMQQSALSHLYSMENQVKHSGDLKLLDDWRKLTTSDHFYYMCTKYFSDGDVHKYFNPYDTPYDGFMIFMNILNDMIIRLKEKEIKPETHGFKGVDEDYILRT